MVIASRNPLDRPLIQLNYMSETSDVDRLMAAVGIGVDISGQPGFRRMKAVRKSPGNQDLKTRLIPPIMAPSSSRYRVSFFVHMPNG